MPARRVLPIVLFLLCAPMALAEGDARLRLDFDSDEATIHIERETPGFEHAVKIEYDVPDAKLELKREQKSPGNESESKLEARFVAIVEYVDGDGDGAYDADETVASGWTLSDDAKDGDVRTNGTADWGEVDVTGTSAGNGTGKRLSTRAALGDGGTFGLDLFVDAGPETPDDASLAPAEAKIDITIQDYPYVRDDTALAVLVDLKAKDEFKSDRESEGVDGLSSQARAGNLTFRLSFRWLENATVDGVDTPVRSTVVTSTEESKPDEVEQTARVALAYARGDLIVHDPSLGVEYGVQGAGGPMATPSASALALVAVAAFAASLVRRR